VIPNFGKEVKVRTAFSRDAPPAEPPETKPNPDPTVYTNDAIERASKALRDYLDGKIETLDQRLKGMDRATDLVETSTRGVPELIEKEVAHLHELVDVEIKAIKDSLSVAEILRVEQKNDSTTGLAAALSAQKELAAAENTSNKLAISKSETSTLETIKNNQDANNTQFGTVVKSIDELKLAVGRLETTKQAVADTKKEGRDQGNYTMAIISSIIGIVLFILGIFGTYLVTKNDSRINNPIVITETVTTP
jgi:LPS O-antigen subunit length determinant protein (WzzB/FepE family)